MNIPQVLAYLLVAVFFASAFLLILSGPIVDWMYAREKRKKAAQPAAAASPASGRLHRRPDHPQPHPSN